MKAEKYVYQEKVTGMVQLLLEMEVDSAGTENDERDEVLESFVEVEIGK